MCDRTSRVLVRILSFESLTIVLCYQRLDGSFIEDKRPECIVCAVEKLQVGDVGHVHLLEAISSDVEPEETPQAKQRVRELGLHLVEADIKMLQCLHTSQFHWQFTK